MTFGPVHSSLFLGLLGDRRVEFYLSTKNTRGEGVVVNACVHVDSVVFWLRIRHKAVCYGVKQSIMTQLNIAPSGVNTITQHSPMQSNKHGRIQH